MSLDLEHSAPSAPIDSTTLLVAWLERRLDATTDWLLDEARLYGVTVRDPDALLVDGDAAARFCLLDRGYPYDIVDGPAVHLAANFDAVAVLTLGWQAPYDPASPDNARPGRHPRRVRVRVVSLVRIDPVPDSVSVATAVRVRGQSEAGIHPEGAGQMIEAMRNLAAEALAVGDARDTWARPGK